MFEEGQIYRRRELHQTYGGQEQGGISTPAGHPFVLLFFGERGEEHGYQDGWAPDGSFYYTGEGQLGDMDFVRGNAAIRDHAENGEELHLFRQRAKGMVEYEGQMEYAGHEMRRLPDTEGRQRQAIVFRLKPADK